MLPSFLLFYLGIVCPSYQPSLPKCYAIKNTRGHQLVKPDRSTQRFILVVEQNSNSAKISAGDLYSDDVFMYGQVGNFVYIFVESGTYSSNPKITEGDNIVELLLEDEQPTDAYEECSQEQWTEKTKGCILNTCVCVIEGGKPKRKCIDGYDGENCSTTNLDDKDDQRITGSNQKLLTDEDICSPKLYQLMDDSLKGAQTPSTQRTTVPTTKQQRKHTQRPKTGEDNSVILFLLLSTLRLLKIFGVVGTILLFLGWYRFQQRRQMRQQIIGENV